MAWVSRPAASVLQAKRFYRVLKDEAGGDAALSG
jgi:hypothetical protein